MAKQKLEALRTTAGRVTIGTLIRGRKNTKSDVWEVVDMAAGPVPTESHHTAYWRVRHITTGEEATIPPKPLNGVVHVMVPEGETEPPPGSRKVSDGEQIMLLVEQLGAQEIATYDHLSGEVTCPNYHILSADGEEARLLGEHMRIAHQMDLSQIEAGTSLIDLHDRAHDPRYPSVGKGGFAHRHVPEDRSFIKW